jgi:hypothetical protein
MQGRIERFEAGMTGLRRGMEQTFRRDIGWDAAGRRTGSRGASGGGLKGGGKPRKSVFSHVCIYTIR